MGTELSIRELDDERADLLPTRETLHFWHGSTNWANIAASNSSLALNAASVYSSAESMALQSITVSQH